VYNASPQEKPKNPTNLLKTDGNIYSAELKEVDGSYEYTLKWMMPNKENDPGNMDWTWNDVLRATFTRRVNELIQANPNIKNLRFEVSAWFGGWYKWTIKLTFDIGDTPSTIEQVDSFWFFAGGGTGTWWWESCKQAVDTKFIGWPNWRKGVSSQYAPLHVQFPTYRQEDVLNSNSDDVNKKTQKVVASNWSWWWKYTESTPDANGYQTFAFYRVDFAVINWGPNNEPKKEIKKPVKREISYPDKQQKLSEWYDRLTQWEKAFLGIVASKVEKYWQSVYKLERDWKQVDTYAQSKIEKIRDTFLPQWYALSISSSYRSSQKQFEEFFKMTSSTLIGSVIPPLSNFMPTEILNDDWTAKAWYKDTYQKLLEEYVTRAEYIAPPWYSEHQTGKAFDIKIKNIKANTEVLLWNSFNIPWNIQNEVIAALEKAWFANSYAREPRHWKYTQ